MHFFASLKSVQVSGRTVRENENRAKNLLALIAAHNHVIERARKMNARLPGHGFGDTMARKLNARIKQLNV